MQKSVMVSLVVAIFSFSAFSEMPVPRAAPAPKPIVRPDDVTEIPVVTEKPNGFTVSCGATVTVPRPENAQQVRNDCAARINASCDVTMYAYMCAEQSSAAGNPDGASSFTCTGIGNVENLWPIIFALPPVTDVTRRPYWQDICAKVCTCSFPGSIAVTPVQTKAQVISE